MFTFFSFAIFLYHFSVDLKLILCKERSIPVSSELYFNLYKCFNFNQFFHGFVTMRFHNLFDFYIIVHFLGFFSFLIIILMVGPIGFDKLRN